MANAIKLRDFFAHFKGEPHQLAAVEQLQAALPRELLQPSAQWVETFRAAPQAKAPLVTPNTWDGVMKAAQQAGARYPELVAAQWALESGWGKHISGKHNYFGLKGPGTKTKTQEVINGKTITITDEFLDFADLDTCVEYLVDRWHRDWMDYKGVNNSATREDAAYSLLAQGYASDPAYAGKLIELMSKKAPLKAKPQQAGGVLKVPYFSQRDSVMPEQALRMCFSSSCAMLLATLKPGSVTGPAADDQYLKRVLQYGDTTDAGAQIKALASYGVRARLVQNASWATLEQQLQKGIPVPCGFLHHGSVANPTGGGHWLCVIGITSRAIVANDPYGEMDVLKGTYLNTKGAGVAYSKANWGPRWMVEGPSTGWALIAER
jgi:hypothetical protein